MRIYQQPIEVHLGLVSTGQPLTADPATTPDPTRTPPGRRNAGNRPHAHPDHPDHASAGLDHASAGLDHASAGLDHASAGLDHASAGLDHASAGLDHVSAGLDHVSAWPDHTSAGTAEPTGTLAEEHTRIEGPARFTWHRRVWVVRTILTRWVQTAPWWDSPAAQAVRSAGIEPDPDADVLGEQEIWRVLASDGRESGVFELLHDPAEHTWQLAKVVD
ncbi:DUF6504 family protein [Granulicoccus phenolivorans]|uniref:DUF6504 family protein n=1 Tax=Granulicoccus phenolivorans TaxID=266854 RepID=UPI0011AE8759|nr:DUF6504 family protein [Granulicoccus phenolivorans]